MYQEWTWHKSVASPGSNEKRLGVQGSPGEYSENENGVKESKHTSSLKRDRMHLKWNLRKYLTFLCVA